MKKTYVIILFAVINVVCFSQTIKKNESIQQKNKFSYEQDSTFTAPKSKIEKISDIKKSTDLMNQKMDAIIIKLKETKK